MYWILFFALWSGVQASTPRVPLAGSPRPAPASNNPQVTRNSPTPQPAAPHAEEAAPGYIPSGLLEMPASMELLDDKMLLQSGESFSYAVLEDLEEPTALYVDKEGEVIFPLVGKKNVAGKTARGLAMELKKELEKKYYYRATVIISRTLLAKGKVFVSGQVATTGSLEIPPSQVWTVSKAILTAGGFTDQADRSRVALIRKDPAKPEAENKQEIDVGKMLETGDFSADPVLRPGDLILVAKLDATARVTVSGQVLTPGVYNIPRRDFTVSQAIMSAGGLAKYANSRKVKLIRQDPQTQKVTTIVVDLKKVFEQGRRDLDPVIEPNDTITVPDRFINF